MSQRSRHDSFDVARRGVVRRDLARLTGDTAGEQAWDIAVHRHLDALTAMRW